jgi:16S rRNA (cytidine1402-2'-O)-methyltransferase
VGTLYVIGAPLATPEDVTLRAIKILRQVRLVVAGEPERARQFLARFDLHPHLIPVPLLGEGLDEALAALETGDVALLQEERSPAPCGPAGTLIQAAVERGFPAVPIPGPVLPLTALVVSGLPTDSFFFLGSLSEGLDLPLPSYIAERRTLVATEEAGRLAETLARLLAALGDRPLVLDGGFSGWAPQGAWRGTLGSALDHVAAYPPQGPCVLVIGGGEGEPARWDAGRLRAEVRTRLDRGQGASEIGRQVAAESGWSRREVYREVLGCQSSQRSD